MAENLNVSPEFNSEKHLAGLSERNSTSGTVKAAGQER
jgi:hypothetical protein